LLPGIGFIVWLVMLTNERQERFEDKKGEIERFASSSPRAVTVIIVLLMAFQFFRSFEPEAVGAYTAVLIMATIISYGLFLWMTNQRLGFYVNLYLSFGILFFLLAGLLFWTSRSYIYAFGILFAFMLYNVAQLILIYPVYHFEDFSYIDEEPADEKNEEGQHEDLLSAFES
jgi:hypothetical protein